MFSNRTPLPLKRALYLGLLYNQVLYAILWLGYYKQSCVLVPRAQMHLAFKLPAKEFKLKHSFHPKYHHLGNLLIKVLNWFLFGKRSGKAFLPVSQKLRSRPLRQASQRQISSLRWAPGAAFRNPWKPDLPCLSGFLLVTLSWVGSRELAFLKPPKTWSALPVRFSPLWPCHG